jgi:hypothetical protein
MVTMAGSVVEEEDKWRVVAKCSGREESKTTSGEEE